MSNNTTEYNSLSQAKTFDEDGAMISAAKEDVEAFGKLYDKYYQNIFRYIHHRTFHHAVAEDLTSNTFFAAFRHIQRYKWKRISFSAWLYQIATNEIRMYYRKQKRTAEISFQGTTSSAGENPTSTEEYALLHQAILKLKPIYQTVITLRFFEDMTIAEISEITGKKEGTIKSQLHRGLGQLKQVLAQNGIVSLE